MFLSIFLVRTVLAISNGIIMINTVVTITATALLQKSLVYEIELLGQPFDKQRVQQACKSKIINPGYPDPPRANFLCYSSQRTFSRKKTSKIRN